MIITVTMNPAIDKTAQLDYFEHGGLNRIQKVIQDAGGKGINVSKTIRELGGKTIATGFLGGNGRGVIESVLEKNEIKSDFVSIKDEIRTNLKVVESGGTVTEINEPGPFIREEEYRLLIEKLLQYAGPDTIFVLAGSLPNGITKDAYKIIIEKVKEKGAKVFLDADGELFLRSVKSIPDMIKPNHIELTEYFKINPNSSVKELITMGKTILEQGINMVTISLGEKGAIFLRANEGYQCPGLQVEAHSTVGAGDAMVAALVYGFEQKLTMKECIKLSLATSAGAVTTIGTKPPSRELVDNLMKKVEIIQLY